MQDGPLREVNSEPEPETELYTDRAKVRLKMKSRNASAGRMEHDTRVLGAWRGEVLPLVRSNLLYGRNVASSLVPVPP